MNIALRVAVSILAAGCILTTVTPTASAMRFSQFFQQNCVSSGGQFSRNPTRTVLVCKYSNETIFCPATVLFGNCGVIFH
jgi:hypothetical protein